MRSMLRASDDLLEAYHVRAHGREDVVLSGQGDYEVVQVGLLQVCTFYHNPPAPYIMNQN